MKSDWKGEGMEGFWCAEMSFVLLLPLRTPLPLPDIWGNRPERLLIKTIYDPP